MKILLVPIASVVLLTLFIASTACAQTCDQRWADLTTKIATEGTTESVIHVNPHPTQTQINTLNAAHANTVASKSAFQAASCVAPPPPPPPTEICGNGIDDNGNGLIDEGCASGAILQQSDFTFIGSYDVPTSVVGGIEWGQGFTLRSGGALPHFLTFRNAAGANYLTELVAPTTFGQPATFVQSWQNAGDWWGNGQFIGLWWDATRQRVWYASAIDYDNGSQLRGLWLSTLPTNGGKMTWRGPLGLAGTGPKQLYGGCQATPTDLQQQYSFLPYTCGWGGYTSLFNQSAYPASLGLAMFATTDPSLGADNTDVSSIQTLANHAAGGTFTDWYSTGIPTNDRGVRNPSVTNYYDNGDPRPNPLTPPTDPPAVGAGWLSPAPDGQGRFVWGDSYNNTGNWIAVNGKRGFVLIASLACGRAYYMTSTLHQDETCFEMQVFDPADLAAVKDGTKAPWAVQPVNAWTITLDGLGRGHGGNGPWQSAAGAAFDPITNRLYIYGIQIMTGGNRIYVYQVTP